MKKVSFITQNGPKVDEAPCRYVNIAPMQSNMLNFMKILKKLFESHLKDFVIWDKLIEKFIVQRNFPVKWKCDQNFEQVLL